MVTQALAVLPPSAYQPGRESRFPWDGLENDIVLYLPTDYDHSKRWPCVFFYHGMNGMPDTRLIRQYTGGRGFVVVGMEYVGRGATQLPASEYLKLLQQEMDTYRDVRRWVTKHWSIDAGRVYMAGASKGGWMTTVLGERDIGNLAGLIICMAGRRWMQAAAKGERAFKGKPVYIGVGENDPNNPFALYAREYYRRLGARVTFDEYPGIGHQMSMQSALLRDWLDVEGPLRAPGAETSDALAEWGKQKVAEVEDEMETMERYRLLHMLRANPKTARCPPDIVKQLSARWKTATRRGSLGGDEWQAEQAFDKAMQKEIAWTRKPRRAIPGLERVQQEYLDISRAYPRTHYGQRAGSACDRLLRALNSAQ